MYAAMGTKTVVNSMNSLAINAGRAESVAAPCEQWCWCWWGIITARHMTAYHVQLKDYMCGCIIDKRGIWFPGSQHTLARSFLQIFPCCEARKLYHNTL